MTEDSARTVEEPVGFDRAPTDRIPVPGDLSDAPPPAPVAAGAGQERDRFDDATIGRFRDRWRELQAGFVDDPAQAVRAADDLVEEIMRELAQRRESLRQRWPAGADTEELRVVIRAYRAFFDRLMNA